MNVMSGPEPEAMEEPPYFSLLSFWAASDSLSFLLNAMCTIMRYCVTSNVQCSKTSLIRTLTYGHLPLLGRQQHTCTCGVLFVCELEKLIVTVTDLEWQVKVCSEDLGVQKSTVSDISKETCTCSLAIMAVSAHAYANAHVVNPSF